MRVMLATDGSKGAQDATRWLETLPLPNDTTVLVVAVADVPDAPLAPPQPPEWRAAILDATRRAAKDAVDALRGRWPTVEVRVPAADPRNAIPEHADALGTDLLVVGARGLGALTGFLVGTVSNAVAHHAHCSVVVVKGTPRPVRRVVIAIDGSQHARAAVRFVAALPLEQGTIVRLVAVVVPPDYLMLPAEFATPELAASYTAIMDEDRRRLDAALGEAEDLLRARPVTIERMVSTGGAAARILAAAEQGAADLIVVGARGRGRMKRLLLGSVSGRLLHEAHVPVLIVKAGHWPADRRD